MAVMIAYWKEFEKIIMTVQVNLVLNTCEGNTGIVDT